MHMTSGGVLRLTKDPNRVEAKSDFVSISAVVNRYDPSAEDNRSADYYNVICFRQVDTHLKNLHKGSVIQVNGEQRLKEYTDKNGKDRMNIQIVADQLSYIDNYGSEENEEEELDEDFDEELDDDFDDLDEELGDELDDLDDDFLDSEIM